MSRFAIPLLLALCVALFISSAQAGTIGGRSTDLRLAARDHEHEPQAQAQEATPTTQNHTPDTSPPETSDVEGNEKSYLQDHPDFGTPAFDDTELVPDQPTPSPEIVRLGPSPENIGAGLGSEKEQNPANRQGTMYDDEGAAGALRMNWVGLSIATTFIMGWLL